MVGGTAGVTGSASTAATGSRFRALMEPHVPPGNVKPSVRHAWDDRPTLGPAVVAPTAVDSLPNAATALWERENVAV